MLRLTDKIKRSRRVIAKTVGKSVYLLDPRDATIHTLNETASFIWKSLSVPRSEEELIRLILRNYEVKPITVRKDVEKFINNYLERGMIEKSKR